MLILKGHGYHKTIYGLAFSPDSARLASTGLDGRVRLWDLSTGKGSIVEQTTTVCGVAYAPDGRTLAWGTNWDVNLYDLATGQTTLIDAGWDGDYLKVRFSPDGRLLAAVGGSVRLWEVATRKRLPPFNDNTHATGALAFTPDGRTLATGHTVREARGRPTAPPRIQHRIRLWDPTTGTECGTLDGPSAGATALAFSPAGHFLAAACGQHLWVWDMRSGQVLLRQKTGTRPCKALAFAPDGRFLATAHNDQTMRFWSTDNWQECAAFDWGIGPLVQLAFAPDGMRVAAGSSSGKIVVADVDL